MDIKEQTSNFKHMVNSKQAKEKIDNYIGVRIDIWTHLMRECIINYVH